MHIIELFSMPTNLSKNQSKLILSPLACTKFVQTCMFNLIYKPNINSRIVHESAEGENCIWHLTVNSNVCFSCLIIVVASRQPWWLIQIFNFTNALPFIISIDLIFRYFSKFVKEKPAAHASRLIKEWALMDLFFKHKRS